MTADTAADAEARFWEHVEITDTCWLWRGTLTFGEGYGHFWYGSQRKRFAHRFAYELLVGEIPEGLVIDHLCRVRHCVNPAHLEAVTDRENILRGVGPTAQNAAKTHCIRGHEFSPENTIISRGKRNCRICTREINARSGRKNYWARKAGAGT